MRAIAKEVGKWLATAALIVAVSVLCPGCATGNGSSVAVTVNFFGSLSRFGQSLGGTDTTIKGQIEGGGNAAATVPLP
jgi:hypothetical protein